MAIHSLIQTDLPPEWQDRPQGWAKGSDENTYLFIGGTYPPEVLDRPELQAVNPVIVGSWDEAGNRALDPSTGQPVEPDLTRYRGIRPLGNNPERANNGDSFRGGDATRHLRYAYFLGFPARALGSNDELYPDDESPFAIEVRHKYFEDPENPQWDGWGWRAEVVWSPQARDPSVRAIGVYADYECTEYLYTTGAFVQGSSDWQLDEAGNPLTVWYTETPVGRAMATKIDWPIAVLLGSAQEGYQTLFAKEDSIEYLFWEHTQPPKGQPQDWKDTGQTVLSLIGAGTYGVSGDSSIFRDGEQMRFGTDNEVTFIREHSPGIIIVDPHVDNAVGLAIYLKRSVSQGQGKGDGKGVGRGKKTGAKKRTKAKASKA